MVFIYWVNRSWGNPIDRSLILSFYTFVMIFMMFNFYWEIRDFWQYRWVNKVDMPGISVSSYLIPLSSQIDQNKNQKSKSIYAELLHSNSNASDCPLVIFTHGFSDNRMDTRFITVPIALAGYDVMTYDCRGSGKSRSAGSKNRFDLIVDDLSDVINFTKKIPTYHNQPIYLLGISLGAMGSIKQGLERDDIEKVIAVAAMGNYRDVLPRSPITFKNKWWVWLRFKIFGVLFNPIQEINYKISPVLQFKRKREDFCNEIEWTDYTNTHFYLIHAKNDKLIPLSHFHKNRAISNLSSENWLISKRGGHMFRKYETILISSIISALKRKKIS